MTTVKVLQVIAVISIVLVGLLRAGQECGDREPYWSTVAEQLSCRGKNPVVVPAPNRQVYLYIDKEFLYVKRGQQAIFKTPVMPLLEVAWSPDSRSFFTTESDGGLVGSWYISVYVLSDRSVRRHDYTGCVRRSFRPFVHCDTAEVPNVAGIAWVDNTTLLVAAEVPPHSSCTNMGQYAGYSISIGAGRILARYSENEVRQRWGTKLGRRLSQ